MLSVLVMYAAISKLILKKMMLGCIIFLTCLPDMHAEEFGVSRRTAAPPQQLLNQQQVLPYVVRIIAFDTSGQSFGTGSYVGGYGEYGIVLTNHHVVYEAESNRLVHVHFPSGFSSFGAIIKTDIVWDLALIAISKPPASISTLPIAKTPSRPGEPLWIVGFGSGLYRIAEGRCVRYLAPENPGDGSSPLYEIMEVSVSARKGDSGGPILNQRGELAGVLFGSDMIRNTAGSYSERVQRFLRETQGEIKALPTKPESLFASIEKEGPIHSLRDSRHTIPQNVMPNVSQRIPQPSPDNANPALTSQALESWNVRSSSRRYVPPTVRDYKSL